MTTMEFPFKKTALATALLLSITSCFHEESKNKNKVNPLTDLPDDKALYYVAAADGEGNLNLYADDGAATKSLGTIALRNASNNIVLGEIHVHDTRAFVVIESGLKDSTGNDVGGGIAVVDLVAALKNPADAAAVQMFALQATKVPGPSRLGHAYVDPDGSSLWVNNDGRRDDADTPGINESLSADSVFRVDWNMPTAHFEAMGIKEIAVGNGHKNSAFSRSVSGGAADVKKYFATHNSSDESITIIGNDATSTTSLQTTTIICLNNRIIGDCPKPTPMANSPHGMDYSPYSGRFYTGITNGASDGLAVAVVDSTTTLDYSLNPASFSLDPNLQIKVGNDPALGQIPVAGFTRASADGKWVYTVGYKGDMGYLSIIQTTQTKAAKDSVLQVIELGNLVANSIEISDMASMKMLTLLIPGANNSSATQSKVAVLELDYVTGKLKGCDLKLCDAGMYIGMDMGDGASYVNIGPTYGEHHTGAVTPDGARVFYPNGGDCAVAPATADGVDCKTIDVIDVMSPSAVAKVVTTAGKQPGAISIISKAALAAAVSPAARK